MNEDQDPLDVLDEHTRQYRLTEKAHDDARERVIAAVLAALRAGKRPTDVAARSPFTDTYVRRVARENGIAPRTRSDSLANRGEEQP